MKNNPTIFFVDVEYLKSDDSKWMNCIDTLISYVSEQNDCYFSFLGGNHLWTQQEWLGLSSGEIACAVGSHFLSPVFQNIQKLDLTPNQFVILTNAEIIDLDDWVLSPDQWIIITEDEVNIHSDMIKFSPENLDGIFSWFSKPESMLKNFPRFKTTGSLGHKWMLDFYDFPMIFIPDLNQYLHLFPVSWSQWEKSIYQQSHQSMEEGMYQSLLNEIGGRVSLMKIYPSNLLSAFATGVYPKEIITFLESLDSGYHLPTVENWRTAWRWLESQPICALPPQIENKLNSLARALWFFVNKELKPNNLLEFSLMKNGVLEWVLINGDQSEENLAGMGKPRKNYPFHHPLTHSPIKPTSIEKRSKLFGLRLMRREEW